MKKSPQPIDIHVGSRIRARRVALGMSQEKLANGLGLTFQQVQKYEKGTNRVGGSRLAQIADILKVKPEFFFEGLPSKGEESDPLITSLARKDVQSLLNGYLNLDAPRQRAIIQFVQQWGT